MNNQFSGSAGLPLGDQNSMPPGAGANPDPFAWTPSSPAEEAGVLTINNLPQFLDAVHRRSDKVGVNMISLLSKLEQVYAAVERGCPCTRRNREQHAETVYMDTMMRATLRDKSDIMNILGVPADYNRAIIRSKNIVLLTLAIHSE